MRPFGEERAMVSRTIRFGNLFLAVVMLIVSFLVTTYFFGLDDSPHYRGGCNFTKVRFDPLPCFQCGENDPYYQCIQFEQIRRIAPFPTVPHRSIPIASDGYSHAEAERHINRLFDPIMQEQEGLMLSDFFKEFLFQYPFISAKGAVSEGSSSVKDTLTKRPVNPLHVLHLCSASTCVNAFISLAFIAQAKFIDMPAISLFSMVYGDALIARAILKELYVNGVRVLSYLPRTANLSSEVSAGFTPACQPLYGANFTLGTAEGEAPVSAVQVNSSGVRCEYYVHEKAMLLEAEMTSHYCRTSEGEAMNLTEVHDRHKEAHAQWPSAKVRAFSSAQFEGKENYTLRNLPIDVVYIDVDPTDAVGVVAYLHGILSDVEASAFLPRHLVVAVDASEWGFDILSAVQSLQRHRGYDVLPLQGACVSTGGPPRAGWIEPGTAWATRLASVQSPPCGSAGRGGRDTGAPGCVLLLTRDRPAVRHYLHLAGSRHYTRKGAMERFFSQPPLSTMNSSEQPAPAKGVSSQTSKGKHGLIGTPLLAIPWVWVSGVVSVLISWLPYGLILLLICVLLWNMSKTWRHRRRTA